MAIAAGVFAPATGLAQQTDVGLNIAFYVPFGSLVESGVKSSPATFYQQRLQATPALGGNITVWTSDHIGFSASFSVSPADVAVTDTTGTHDHSSTVVLAGARVIYAFTPLLFKPPAGHREIPWSFYVGGGLGVVSRSGSVWTYSSGLTAPALLLDVGVRTAMGGRSILRFDVEDYISQAQFDKGLPTETESRIHHDFLFSITLSYRVKR